MNRMRKNMDQRNSDYRHFLSSVATVGKILSSYITVINVPLPGQLHFTESNQELCYSVVSIIVSAWIVCSWIIIPQLIFTCLKSTIEKLEFFNLLKTFINP